MVGRYCRLEALAVDRHASSLHEAYQRDTEARLWTYLPYGPFDSFAAYVAWMHATCMRSDPLFFAIINASTNRATGVCAFLRIDPPNGSIEVGHLTFSPLLQRTTAATEAMFLMMKRAFDLGYRRCEWKCDALNESSSVAAKRLGFTYEGTFRQAAVYKQRSRDTAWFSIIDREWPALRAAYEQWLSPENFDESGRQRARLSDFIAKRRKTT
jgi:RimJ/RimL family protein N-acetyltransferase